MRRTAILVLVFILIALAGLVPALTGARQDTPIAGTPPTAGVGGGPLGIGHPEAAPDHVLSLRRGIFEPGAYVSLHHHPGALVLYVESGSLVYTVAEGVAIVTRAAPDGTPGPTEEVGPGTAATLRPGDTVFEQGVVHTTVNEGSEPAVVLIAALASADESFTIFHEMGTPAP
jgi:quercetin dioxygenase-like cupin family protein